MARIKLDFTKTEERSGWNTRQIPEGIYAAEIVSLQETEAQDGTAMLVYGFRPTEKRFRTRLFPYYCKLQQNQLWKLRDLLVAAGMSVPKKVVNIDPNKIVGAAVAIEVEDDTYNGQVRSTVQSVYSLDLLDDLDDEEAADEPEELEDDFEEDELDEDFEEDDFEDDDELDEDDLDDDELDDEDEDDFDDELEDDFEEEEEEEEEPAPAPKKKPAAKAAPKRRVVKRSK